MGQQKFTATLIPDFAYKAFLKIKKQTLQDIQHRMQYIKKEENRKFYDVLNKNGAGEEDGNTDDEEEEENVDDYE